MKQQVVRLFLVLFECSLLVNAFVVPLGRSKYHGRSLLFSSSTLTTASPSPSPSSSSSSASASSASSSASWRQFDYLSHWYPVIWARDLPLNEPVKVTVFDVDYVVARVSDNEVMAMQDQCPHKAAALSQGRVTSTGHFQCAYHGWSFNGTSGQCVDIPQIAAVPTASKTKTKTLPSKSGGTAVPAQIFQEMVWLFPGGGLEQALQAPPPPSVPQLEEISETTGKPVWKLSTSLRDMPVDWPIVVSNICDADHGIFAHQAKAFDMYSASKEYPLQVTEEFPNDGKGYVLKTAVDATEKILQVDRKLRESLDPKDAAAKKSKKGKEEQETPLATSFLQLPGHLQLKRVTKDTNTTSFISAFYICPVGVGRTRFMSSAIAKKVAPDWLGKLFLDNFLDQDTYLLATQQQNILSQEAKDIRALMEQQPNQQQQHQQLELELQLQKETMSTRRNMFCFSSPTEKAGAKLEQFWDATLLRVPNRVSTLLQLDAAGTFRTTPSREAVLDRKAQHLDIRPNSQDVVRNCKRAVKASKAVAIAVILAKLVVAKSTSWAQVHRWNSALKPSLLGVTLGLSWMTYWVAKWMQREYYFKYTDDDRRNDLSKIPKMIWLDK